MAIAKNKDATWKTYLNDLVEFGSKISDIEHIELSGYLLRRDMENEWPDVLLRKIFSQDDYDSGFLIANFLIAESPDTLSDLNDHIRTLVVSYYSAEIDELFQEAIETIKEERLKYDPRTEPEDAA